MKKLLTILFVTLLGACQTQQTSVTPVTTTPQDPKPVQRQTPVVGGVETAYVLPFSMPFHARMDTGAETSSIDAKNIKPFERDGDKWVSFDIVNRKNAETHHFEKPIKRKTSIIRTGKKEHRYVVIMDIKMGQKLIKAEFTLNDRKKFNYQLLIGRNIINGRYIVDPTLQNTLH